MEKKYVISRYSGTKKEIRFNVSVAKLIAKMVLESGFIPVVPHIYFTQFLDDRIPEERKKGTDIGIELLKECDRAVVVIVDGVISKGMEAEIQVCKELGKPLQILQYNTSGMKRLLKERGV